MKSTTFALNIAPRTGFISACNVSGSIEISQQPQRWCPWSIISDWLWSLITPRSGSVGRPPLEQPRSRISPTMTALCSTMGNLGNIMVTESPLDRVNQTVKEIISHKYRLIRQCDLRLLTREASAKARSMQDRRGNVYVTRPEHVPSSGNRKGRNSGDKSPVRIVPSASCGRASVTSASSSRGIFCYNLHRGASI